MSASIRQSNLFAASDYQKVFQAYQFIDYTAYDFDTLKQALINYIQTYYPESFNDYIESSEFIAIIELLAYFGTSLAFRTDLNSRENFIDTATRRESIIRLAQMVNYVPRRNVPASGLFKISAVQTNEPMTDANGTTINDISIYWNDPNNTDWFDQFVQVCNGAFSTLNPFGRPTKNGSIGSIPTDLYQLNSVINQNITYPISVTINGQQYPIDVCNPDFTTNETIFERSPDPANAFNFIYRNDSLGVASANTGFFLYFKQGTLSNTDTSFQFPVPNRSFPLTIQNVNQDDVYVQQTDQAGNVLAQWLKVPALAGENIIYNSIQNSQRNIFDVISGVNDTITVRFSDGNFGNVPSGLFRIWTRSSANLELVIRPDNVQGVQIAIPYVGSNQQQYTLTITFDLQQTIGNAAASETNEQIKLRAPEVFSTQSRMVNGSDYNVLPLIYGNQIAKVQAINRTYSGQSRFIDITDPTGFHKDLIIFGQDGALYRDDRDVLNTITKDISNTNTINTILIDTIQSMLSNSDVSLFFYDEYLTQFESTIRVNPTSLCPNGCSILDLTNPANPPLLWRTSPATFKNNTGYFSNMVNGSISTAVVLNNTFDSINTPSGTYEPWGFITTGCVLEFQQSQPAGLQSTPVETILQSGLPNVVNPLNPYSNIGPIGIGVDIQNNSPVIKIYPTFRNALTASEISEINTRITNGISFWIYYDLLQDEWHTSITTLPGVSDMSQVPFVYAPAITVGATTEIYSNWAQYPNSGILYVNITNNTQSLTTTFNLTARGRSYVFESYKDVRFYWEPNQVIIDNASGLALQDTVRIMPYVNTNSSVDNNQPVITNPSSAFLSTPVDFNITDVYVRDDGYQDETKIIVSLVDTNSDGIPDDPAGFTKIVSSTDRVIFEYYNNEITGYQSTRPWIANWGTLLENYTGNNIYVYFPINPANATQLYGTPFISNVTILDPLNPNNTPGATVMFMDQYDLFLIDNILQLTFNATTAVNSIANQITAFFNGPTTTDLVHYPWLAGTQNIVTPSKQQIMTNYFLNKSFLLNNTLPGYGEYYSLNYQSTSNLSSYPAGQIVVSGIDAYHFDKNGKVFTQNTVIPSISHVPVYFQWSHYSPVDQRVDPAPTNIVDMVVITNSYYTDMVNWNNSAGSLASMPIAPTTEDLRIQFQNLDQYKMVSDSIIWNSGNFMILFGPQAAPQLQATFNVVKSMSTNVSDNEICTQVIQAIGVYFDIRNWDFGETFYYTELAAFIHQQLSGIISSVVIVPSNGNASFGSLFEIVSGPNQLFMSTATVNNVNIVPSITNQNTRI